VNSERKIEEKEKEARKYKGALESVSLASSTNVQQTEKSLRRECNKEK
jgi:predicted restriction endonuclease